MPCIGEFTKTPEGFSGQLRLLLINTKSRMVKADTKGNAKAPDYRVFTGAAGGAEIGAAWSKTTSGGKPYLSVKLDDPSFPAPAWARLTEVGDAGIHELIWQRDLPRGEKPEPGAQT